MNDSAVEIVQNPRIRAGKPVIAGTRVGVHDVVNYARLYGGDLDRVRSEALPHVSRAQLEAALAWHEAHPGVVESILREAERDYQAGLAQDQADG